MNANDSDYAPLLVSETIQYCAPIMTITATVCCMTDGGVKTGEEMCWPSAGVVEMIWYHRGKHPINAPKSPA
jgi:hypothetical protein